MKLGNFCYFFLQGTCVRTVIAWRKYVKSICCLRISRPHRFRFNYILIIKSNNDNNNNLRKESATDIGFAIYHLLKNTLQTHHEL